MTTQVEIKIENDVISLSGDLDFSNVMTVYQQGVTMIKQIPSEVIIDFSGLVSANSAAIALIIDWKLAAEFAGKKLHIKHLGNKLTSLISAAGMEQVIE